MCGRVNVADHEGLRALLAMMGMQVWPVAPPRFNVAPSATIDVITLANDVHRLESMRWGFTSKGDGSKHALLFNARSETVFEKPTFRSSAMSQRAIVPINGFYEWQKNAHGQRRAFYIAKTGAPAMALAAIYQTREQLQSKLVKNLSTAQQDDSQQLSLGFGDDENEVQHDARKPDKQCTSENHHPPENNVCVLTTAANEQMRVLHERMPLVLDPAQALQWLCEGDEMMLAACCKEAQHTDFSIRQVDSFVNNAANDGPECLSLAR